MEEVPQPTCKSYQLRRHQACQTQFINIGGDFSLTPSGGLATIPRSKQLVAIPTGATTEEKEGQRKENNTLMLLTYQLRATWTCPESGWLLNSIKYS